MAFLGAIVGGVVAAGAGAVISSAMADDYGAEDANNAAAEANRVQAQVARDQWNRYKELYEPLERHMVDEAYDYATPENYIRAAGEASASVSQQYGKARDRLLRTPGFDPSSAAAQAGMIGLEMAQAATDATQQNLARQGVSDTAYMRKQAALGLGNKLDSTAASGMASAAQSMNQRAGMLQAQANASKAQASDVGGQIGGLLGKAASGWINNAMAPTPAPSTSFYAPTSFSPTPAAYGVPSSGAGAGLSLAPTFTVPTAAPSFGGALGFSAGG